MNVELELLVFAKREREKEEGEESRRRVVAVFESFD
jgi:hypothetical protein